MVCGGNADAALQDEGHCSARVGGRIDRLKASRTIGKTVLDGNASIRTVMASQANDREKTPV